MALGCRPALWADSGASGQASIEPNLDAPAWNLGAFGYPEY